jgi:hypothetical protein
MPCPGLHCPGCTGGQSLAVLGTAVIGLAVAYETVAVVAAHIWEIGLTTAACLALSVAASVALERWSDRRAAAWGAARGIYSRADMILPAREVPAALPPAGAPAIEQHVHYEIHYHQAGRAPVSGDVPGLVRGSVLSRESPGPAPLQS